MDGKECRAMRREIDQSELGRRLSEPAEMHLASCAPCSEFRAQRSRLRELVGGLEPVVAPADFDVRLRARIVREKESRAQQPFIFRFIVSTPAIVVTAVLVLLAGSIVWFSQRNGKQPTTTASTETPNKQTTADTNPASVAVNNESRATAPVPPVTVDNSKPNGHSNSQRQNPAKPSPGPQSSDFSVSRAPAIKQAEQRPGEVSLSAPIKPMVVSMQDVHGATRRILLPPISFGSQRLVDNRIPVSATNSRDW
jgi:hypothetical protein